MLRRVVGAVSGEQAGVASWGGWPPKAPTAVGDFRAGNAERGEAHDEVVRLARRLCAGDELPSLLGEGRRRSGGEGSVSHLADYLPPPPSPHVQVPHRSGGFRGPPLPRQQSLPAHPHT